MQYLYTGVIQLLPQFVLRGFVNPENILSAPITESILLHSFFVFWVTARCLYVLRGLLLNLLSDFFGHGSTVSKSFHISR